MRKTLLMIIAVLTTFLLVSDSIIYLHHKNTLYTEFRETPQPHQHLLHPEEMQNTSLES